MKKISLLTLSVVLLSLIYSCKKKDDEITVNKPTADFEIAFVSGANVTLLNKSSNYSSSTWDFGDGTKKNVTSGNNAPITHKYSKEGVYTISLTVKGDEGEASASKKVTISSIPVAASATANNPIETTPTKIKASFSLTSGTGEGSTSDFFIELSKTDDFSVLEDLAPSSNTSTNQKVNNKTEYEIAKLTPGETFYYRIRIDYKENFGSDKVVSYSNTVQATTKALPKPTITAKEGSSPHLVEISSSLSIDDFQSRVEIKEVIATDANFTNIITLEQIPSFNPTYFREPGTTLYIKATATVNGKTSEKITQFNSPKDYYTATPSFNDITNAQVILRNNKTVLVIGNITGERLTYFFANPIKQGDEITVTQGVTDPAKTRAIYTDADGKEHTVSTNNFIPKLVVYKMDDKHAFVRWDDHTGRIPFGKNNFKTITGLTAKATIQ